MFCLKRFAFVPVLFAIAVGCGKKDDPPAPLSGVTLARGDLSELRSTSHSGFRAFDLENGGLFSAIFGGTTADHVASYLDTRVRHYLDRTDQTSTISRSANGADGEMRIRDYVGDANESSDSVMIGAFNLGIDFWLQSAITGRPYFFRTASGAFPIDSSRVGIIYLGPAYSEVIRDRRGNSVTTSRTFRQAILLHEARHSDCTGGLSQRTIEALRSTRSDEEQLSLILGQKCGHTHVPCPPSHRLAGEFACDKEPWGAYRIDAIYQAAVAKSADVGSLEYNQALLGSEDSNSRVLVPMSGWPDMSSDGVVP